MNEKRSLSQVLASYGVTDAELGIYDNGLAFAELMLATDQYAGSPSDVIRLAPEKRQAVETALKEFRESWPAQLTAMQVQVHEGRRSADEFRLALQAWLDPSD